MAAFIGLEKATIQHQSNIIFKDLNLSVAKGEILCVLGPSGCGKSTLLKALAGLKTLTQGQVLWPTHQPRFGFVFQDPQLLHWRNVLENVRLPLELRSIQDANEVAAEALSKVNLQKSAQLFPHQLSGGMSMRVSLARALVAKPEVLFMDEPFAALDEMSRFALQEELLEVKRRESVTVIFVTHSIYEAAFLADRVLILPGPASSAIGEETIVYSEVRDQRLRSSTQYQEQVRKLTERLMKDPSL